VSTPVPEYEGPRFAARVKKPHSDPTKR
jgi:hypothetical protein